MSVILCLVLVSCFSYFTYRYHRLHQIKKKLSWMSIVPGWPIIGNGLEFGGTEGAKWRQRSTTPAFHFSILQQFVEAFQSNGKILVEKLKKSVGQKELDVYPLINLYALDVICETAMGVKIEAQKYENSDYMKNVKQICQLEVVRTTSLIKSNDFFYIPDYYKEKKAVQELHNVTYSVIDTRLKNFVNKEHSIDNNKDDQGRKKKLAFLDILLQSAADGKCLSIEDIREEVDTIAEGHDTTTSAISFSLYLLAKYPEVQQRAIEEQKYIFSDNIHRDCTYNDLQDMKYLECVIKEVLRFYPSVPLFGRYVDKDVTYKGQKFAMLEMKSRLSEILRNFEVLPSIPEHKLILAEEAVLKSKNGVKIRLAVRTW